MKSVEEINGFISVSIILIKMLISDCFQGQSDPVTLRFEKSQLFLLY